MGRKCTNKLEKALLEQLHVGSLGAEFMRISNF